MKNRFVGIVDRKNITWTCRQFAKMIANNAINFEHIVQRSFVWETERKSKLIDSILLGYYIPSVWAKARDPYEGEVSGRSNKVYVILDGKQRLSSIADFINDKYALKGLEKISYEDADTNDILEVSLEGKKYSELPKELQDTIGNASIGVNYYDNLDDEGQQELFIRLNNGKPLSTKSKTLANCKCITDVMEIGKHPMFNEMLTEKARANKNEVSIIFKIWEMINLPIAYVDFSSKAFNETVSTTEITEAERDGINNALDFMLKVYESISETKVKKKFINETNFVSMIPFVAEAFETGCEETKFAEFVTNFFNTGDKRTSVSELYNECSSNGTAKSHNIVGRHTALKKEFDAMFAPVCEEEETDDCTEEFAETA